MRSLLSSACRLLRDSSRALHYYARLDLKQLRPHYIALFQWLDYQAVPPHPGAPPPYFSGNLGGLLGALQPVETVAVQRWVVNRTLHEEVIYRGQLVVRCWVPGVRSQECHSRRLSKIRFAEAIADGEFENLRGKGRALELESYFQTPEPLRMAYSMLKSAEFVPEEVRMMQEIDAAKAELSVVRRRTTRDPTGTRNSGEAAEAWRPAGAATASEEVRAE